MEFTFVNKDDIFQYYNDALAQEMIFRADAVAGRTCVNCAILKILERLKAIMQGLREGKRQAHEVGQSNHVENLCMSPMRQCAMKPETF